MSGIECDKLIRQMKLGIHIVIMAGLPDAESFSDARKIGADNVDRVPGSRLCAIR